mgnify:CR=1 FL=1
MSNSAWISVSVCPRCAPNYDESDQSCISCGAESSGEIILEDGAYYWVILKSDKNAEPEIARALGYKRLGFVTDAFAMMCAVSGEQDQESVKIIERIHMRMVP